MRWTPRRLFIALLAVVLVLSAAGIWYFIVQQQDYQRQAEERLMLAAQLKAAEIAAWRQERLGDAAVLQEAPFLVEGVARYLAEPNEQDATALRDLFASLERHYHYADVLLVDPEGQMRLSLSGQVRDRAGYMDALNTALREHRPVFIDLHVEEGNGAPHTSVVAPLFAEEPDQRPLGAIILISDASRYLYPLLQSWPAPSASAETLLVRRDGDSVLFLSDLRHQPDAALKLRIPLTQTAVPAVVAVLGQQGVMEGVDYRGVPVVSVILPVPDSPWYIVAKEDSAEVFAAWRAHSRTVVALFATLMGLSILGAVIGWQKSQRTHLGQLYQAEVALRASMERQSITLKAIGDAVIATDVRGCVELLNPAAERLTGWSEAEAKGLPLAQVFHIVNEDTRTEAESPVERVLHEGVVVGLANHTLLIAKDGTAHPIADSGAPIHDAQGQVTGAVLAFSDQTRERAAQLALQESEQRYRSLFQNNHAAMLVIDPDSGAIVDANPAAVAYYGWSHAEIVTKKMTDINTLPPDEVLAEMEAARREYRQHFYFRHRHADGAIRDVEVYSGPITLDGRPLLYSIIHDISERRQAEQSLRYHEHLLHETGRIAKIGGWELDAITGQGTWTEEVAHIHDLDPDDVISVEAGLGFYTDESRPIITKAIQEAIEAATPYDLELEIISAKGVRKWVRTIGHPEVDDGKVTRIYGSFQDVTERRRAEEKLRQNQEQLRSLIQYAPVSIAMFDRDMRYIATSRRWATDYGQDAEDLVGRLHYEVFPDLPEAMKDVHQRAMAGEHIANDDDLWVRADGTRQWLRWAVLPWRDAEGEIGGIIISSEDITERKLAEEALRRNDERLRSLVNVLQYPATHMQAFLDFALEQAIQLTASRLGYVYFYDEETRRFTLNTWSRGVMQACDIADAQTVYELDKTGIWGEAVRQRRPIILNDFQAPHPLKRGYPEGHARLDRFMTVPVFSGDRIVAVVGMANKSTDYDETDTLQLTLLMDGVWKVVEHRQTEEALQASERHFRTIMASMQDIVFTLDREQRHTGVYGPWVQQLGMTPEQFLGRTSVEIMGPEASQAHAEANNQALKGEFVVYDWSAPAPDGTRYYQTSLSPITDENGQVQGLVGVGRDITDIRRAEKERQASYTLLTNLAEQVPGVVYQYQLFPDGRSRFPYASPGIQDIYEVTPEEVREDATPVFGRLHPEDYDRISAEISESARTQQLFHSEFRVLLPRQGVRWRLCDAKPTLLEDGSTLWHGIISDITDRKEVEADLAESEGRYRQLVQASPYALIVHQDYHVVFANPAAARLLGADHPDELIGKPMTEIVPEDEFVCVRERWARVRAGELGVYPAESRYIRKGGSEVLVEVTVDSVPFDGKEATQILAVDISERKRAEQERDRLQDQLTQAQKMESVGRLAGGVAHDFNNMLSVIIGNTDLALEAISATEPIRADLVEIRKAAERSANLTRQLLAFARKQTISPMVLDLNETVGSMLRMLQRLIGEDIDLVWRPGARLWPIRMDPAQIDQILANLAVNARDAIAGVGNLTIETGNVVFDETYCATHSEFVPGQYVMLAVSDTGMGMSKETLSHLFEPFFTTKDVGKGTGLGLATIYGIVRQNNGFVNVYSELGQGTIFKLYLPRTPEPMVVTPRLGGDRPAGGSETVLIVEDEAAILKLGQSILERYGYTVLAARTPAEALVLAAQHTGPIHLLVTDVVMPEMNGRDLQERIRILRPDIKVLYMSGYTANVIAHHGVLDEGLHFLQKPFSVRTLGTLVRQTLEG